MLNIVLCPSDKSQKIRSTFAPTNYVACTGADERFVRATSGSSKCNGLPQQHNSGLFKISQRHSIAEIHDGTTNTMAISECKLGDKVVINTGGGTWAGVQSCIDGSPSGSPRGDYPRGWTWYAAKYPQS